MVLAELCSGVGDLFSLSKVFGMFEEGILIVFGDPPFDDDISIIALIHH